MDHIHYDEESGKLLGFYEDGVSQLIPSPTIVVTKEVKEEVQKAPHRFYVDGKMLKSRETSPLPSLPPRRPPITEFTYDKKVYVVDKTFLNNLSINLSISCMEKSHVCKLWCRINGEFKLTDHTSEDLIGLAKAYETARHR